MSIDQTPGHVFVTRGDLTALACDAWLVPTDASLAIEEPWRSAVGDLAVTPPRGWSDDGLRAIPLQRSGPAEPVPWLVNVGGTSATSPEWHIQGVRDWILGASRALQGTEPLHGRARHLLALPVVGTGHGGAADAKGEITQWLVAALVEEAARHHVDVALVTHTAHAFAAAHEARRRLDIPPVGLTPELVDLAVSLATEARQGRLVLFLGAGIGKGAGLPMWSDLVDQLARDAGMSDDERERLAMLADPLDRARIVEGRLATRKVEIGSAIALRFSGLRRTSLAHTLLSSLPITESATTNYDTLFEQAREAAGRGVAVLPYDSAAGADGWLLKMHGSVDHPEDIVLTRDDYLGYAEQRAALKGIVQALLITRHMLFVGFSLTDPTFHQVVHDVRRAVRRSSGPPAPFGTAVMFDPDPMLSELWRSDIDIIGVGGETAEPGRQLEIFLDHLLSQASTNSAHVLDPSYEGLLSESEIALRDALLKLAGAGDGVAGDAPAWSIVRRMLDDLGGTPGPG